MSNTVRENDVDVDEIREKMSPTEVDDAWGHVHAATMLMHPLRKGYGEGTSPEVLRALAIVERALAEALNELDPDEQQETSEDEQAYM